VPLDLASEQNFLNGTYDVSIELGRRDDDRMDAAIRACWGDPSLEGCWTDPFRDRLQPRVEPSLESHHEALFGIAAIPGFGSTLCSSHALRYDDDNGADDWLEFGFPVGAMVSVDPRANSLWEWSFDNLYEEHSAPWAWRKPIDDFLVDIATRVAKAAPFELGVIGHEPDTPTILNRKSLAEPIQPRAHCTLLVPDARGELVRIAHPYERPFPG
jgi:hypothetical protein